MKHHALEQLQVIAEVGQDYPEHAMSRNKRLERWAELLEQNPTRRLAAAASDRVSADKRARGHAGRQLTDLGCFRRYPPSGSRSEK